MHVDLTDYQLTKEDKERIHLLSIVEKKGLKPLNLENLRLLERLVEKKDYGTSKKAKSENKPIFLSVGYSSCHWCHVMAHESFENEDIARVLNDNFINIKVDREERPDIDDIYQKACQMVTGQGGWPLSVFLTPEKKPFYTGTYFPPLDSYNRPGLPSAEFI